MDLTNDKDKAISLVDCVVKEVNRFWDKKNDSEKWFSYEEITECVHREFITIEAFAGLGNQQKIKFSDDQMNEIVRAIASRLLCT